MRGMYAALRLQAAQWRVTRPPWASSALDLSGMRSTSAEPHEGHTRGFWSRSAAIRISASGARYSLIPRRPTVGPSKRGTSGTELAPPLTSNLPVSCHGAKARYLAQL